MGNNSKMGDNSDKKKNTVKGHNRNISVKSGHRPKTRCCLNVFLFLALVAILFSGAEPF